MAKKGNQKPLTLNDLVKYSHEILFPAMEERFATKEELKNFEDKTLTSLDSLLKKMDILLTEKEVREYQEEKEKKLFAIFIKALKKHNILSPKELKQIAQLEIF